jgi:hypothetical protein
VEVALGRGGRLGPRAVEAERRERAELVVSRLDRGGDGVERLERRQRPAR